MIKRIHIAPALVGASLALIALTGFTAIAPHSALAANACTTANSTPGATGSPIAGATVVAAQAPAPEVLAPGDIPDSQAFVTYQSTAGGYSIVMPEGWARTENGPNVHFADPSHEFSVAIDCAAAAPTIDTVKTNEIPALTQTIAGFTLVDVTAVQLPAGPAIKIHYQANSNPDAVTGKQHRLDVERFELFKGGRLAVIALAVPAGADNADVSNQVTTSFQWTA